MSTQAPTRDPESRSSTDDRLRAMVLDVLIVAGPPLTVGQVAEAVGLHPDAARRVLRALETEGKARPHALVRSGVAYDELWSDVRRPII